MIAHDCRIWVGYARLRSDGTCSHQTAWTEVLPHWSHLPQGFLVEDNLDKVLVEKLLFYKNLWRLSADQIKSLSFTKNLWRLSHLSSWSPHLLFPQPPPPRFSTTATDTCQSHSSSQKVAFYHHLCREFISHHLFIKVRLSFHHLPTLLKQLDAKHNADHCQQ